jgi:hypothetical protein
MFLDDLDVGHAAEKVISHEFSFQGIPVQRTEGKHDFDFFLPDGRSAECKLDLRSLATNYAVIEDRSMDREADFYFHTLCYTLVFPNETYHRLDRQGKIVKIGDYQYEGRIIKKTEMRQSGIYLDQFIRQLQQ